MPKLTLLACLLYTASLFAQSHNYSEREYADYIQNLIGGEREVSVYGGRVDLVTDEVAWEIEWAANWKESIGQALWYGLQTDKKAGIILIMEVQDEYKYYQQLNSALTHGGLEDAIEVRLFPVDFEDTREGKN